MKRNDGLELKIIRVALPLLIYYGIQLVVQTFFGIYAMIKKFGDIEGSDSAGYILAYNFLDNTEEYIGTHSLVVLFIAAVPTIFILSFMMKREFGDTVFSEWENIGKKEVLIFSFMGIFIASGLGRLVQVLPMDNIIGSYKAVSEEFASNSAVFQILALCIAAPVAEEIIFRGIMYRRLLEYTDKVTAVIFSAAVFGIYHGNLVQGIYALILGVLLCFVYDSCKSLMAPILVHIMCNTAALIMMYFPVSQYITDRLILNIVVIILELAGMVFFTWMLYNLKQKEKGQEKNRNV